MSQCGDEALQTFNNYMMNAEVPMYALLKDCPTGGAAEVLPRWLLILSLIGVVIFNDEHFIV